MTTEFVPPPAAGGSETSMALPSALLHQLTLALRSIRYGAIELVIHDGRVVQLEKREKVRLQIDVTPSDDGLLHDSVSSRLHLSEGRPDHRKPPTSSSREIDV